jgi:hypothetical protein
MSENFAFRVEMGFDLGTFFSKHLTPLIEFMLIRGPSKDYYSPQCLRNPCPSFFRTSLIGSTLMTIINLIRIPEELAKSCISIPG